MDGVGAQPVACPRDGELMGEIAAQREERARVYRQIAAHTPDRPW